MIKTRTLFVLLFLFCAAINLFAQRNSAEQDKAINLFEPNSDVDFFSQISPSKKRPLKRSVSFNEDRLKFATRIGNKRGAAIAANNLGINHLQHTDYDKAIEYFNQTTNLYTEVKDEKAAAVTKAELAFAYDQKGDDEKALQLYSETLSDFDKAGIVKPKPFVQALYGIIFLQRNDTANASQNINAALQQFEQGKNGKAKMQLLKRLGEVQLSKNQYTKAVEYFTKYLQEAQAQKDNKQIAIALRDIGIVYFKKGDYEKAVGFFNHSLTFDDALIVKKLIQDAYLKIVTVSSFKKDYDKADKYHELYRKLKGELRKNKNQDDNNSDEQLAEKEKIIELLSKQNEEQNKILTQQDYELSQQLTATEIERQSKEKALEELGLTTEEKKQKEAELEKMSAEKAKQELLLSQKEVMLVKQEKFRNILLFASGIILLAAFFLFNRYKLKKRSLEELNKAHEELNEAHNKLKQTQEQLVQSEKMASLGQLTAGIAHEIQNPLNFVNNFSKMSVELLDELQKEKSDDVISDLKVNLSKINHHGNRISEIVKGMLLHSRHAAAEKQLADLNALVDESMHLAFHGRRSSESNFNCKLEKNFDTALPHVNIIQQDVRRVVINIINNAFYAVQKKYEMMRAEDHQTEFMPTVSVFTERQNGSAVIKVRDNGSGIPDEMKDKIFNPFFTSKPTGEGTGLGLSVSYDIVTKSHNGVIRFETEKNLGSTFFVELPIN